MTQPPPPWTPTPAERGPAPVADSLARIGTLVNAAVQRRTDDARAVVASLPEYLRVEVPELRDRIHSTSFLDVAKGWDPRRHGNLLLLGNTGKGKSAAGGFLFRRLLAQGLQDGEFWPVVQNMVWADSEELQFALRQRRDPPELASAMNASLLFLDELGSETDPWHVAAIVAHRYKRGRRTVFLGGLDPAELTARYAAPVVRKIRRAGGLRPVVAQSFQARPAANGNPPQPLIDQVSWGRPDADQEAIERRIG